MKLTNLSWMLLIPALAGCAIVATHKLDQQYGTAQVRPREISQQSRELFYSEVKPILDARCVVCHACYDAPCQTKLSSIEGIDRGSSPTEVYEGTRLLAIAPSRLYTDAQSTKEWRAKGFRPILNERIQSPEVNLTGGLMYQLLAMKANNPHPDGSIMPSSFDFRRERTQVCPTIESFTDYEKQYPLWGMPYGLPPLSEAEFATIRDWLAAGAVVGPRPPLSEAHLAHIQEWESFLNQDDLKSQLMSRYIYEHLFIADLYFEHLPVGEYFKLVRSATPPGEPIEIIATRRPYEDPKVERVFYRLRRELSSISEKTHMPYSLSSARMKRWTDLFLTPEYTVRKLPSYKPKVAANPFRAFRAIPVRARYNFLLDEAMFTIMGFIKGPVCRGQTALNVIEDRFWVFFLNPDLPESVHGDEFYEDARSSLELPTKKGSNTTALATWLEYSYRQKKFLTAKREFIAQAKPNLGETSVDLIWNGGQSNKNAALTIFRHFDSATVVRGLIGDSPKTVWLISYGILERLHYLLVAGFDVFGNVGHQINSRLYMDFLRMESESNFLNLLPAKSRKDLADQWYRDAGPLVREFLHWSLWDEDLSIGIPSSSENPKVELLQLLQNHLGNAVDQKYALTHAPARYQSILSKYSGYTGRPISYLAQLSFLRIRSADGDDRAFTLIHDNGLKNVSSPFFEKNRRVPEEDELTIVTGILGAYPYAFFDVAENELEEFFSSITTLSSEKDYRSLQTRFGVRRNSPNFWEFSDWLHEEFSKQSAVESGLLDYNRFENR